ncbi:hypothetical protein ACQV9O_27305, partial [Ralstonia pseudosolanacearum]|uniref:hypothetical protein n=1 Tax=Ralstonia pseudosolanacearum TaxID=1310165 RepID=UPI003D2862C4
RELSPLLAGTLGGAHHDGIFPFEKRKSVPCHARRDRYGTSVRPLNSQVKVGLAIYRDVIEARRYEFADQ